MGKRKKKETNKLTFAVIGGAVIIGMALVFSGSSAISPVGAVTSTITTAINLSPGLVLVFGVIGAVLVAGAALLPLSGNKIR